MWHASQWNRGLSDSHQSVTVFLVRIQKGAIPLPFFWHYYIRDQPIVATDLTHAESGSALRALRADL